MKPETIQRLDDYFADTPVLLGGSAPAAEVDDAEQRIGMTFDCSYREFIERYGGGVVGSLPILGLRKAEVMASDTYSVAEVTARFRADGWVPTHEWIVISVDLAGNPIGLTASGQVWISDHDAGEILMLAPTFEDFVIHLLDQP